MKKAVLEKFYTSIHVSKIVKFIENKPAIKFLLQFSVFSESMKK